MEAYAGIDLHSSNSYIGVMDKGLSKVGVDSPIAYFVGVGHCVPRHIASNAHVIEFFPLCAKTCFDIPETFSIG